MTDVKEQARRLYELLDAQDWSEVAKAVSSDLTSQVGSMPPMGFTEWRAALQAFYVGFPDGHHVIDDYLVEGDRVVTCCRFLGTHSGAFHDIPPSGRKVSVGVIHIDRFVGTKLVEHFGQLDMLGLLRQLGAG